MGTVVNTLIMVFSYQCPNSFFVFFPEEVYREIGSSEVLPHLLQCLPSDKVKAVQFLRGGIVRITFENESVRNEVLARGISFQELQLRVICAMSDARVLYVHDLPVEVPDDVVSLFLASYGDVVNVVRSTYKDFPSVCDGNRVVRIVLKQEVPHFVRIADCNCHIWYARQPTQCVICRETGHLGLDCPLSGRCRRCRQPGHVARQCTQAWGRAAAVDGDNDDHKTDDNDDVDENNVEIADAVLESQASVVRVPESSPQPKVVPSSPCAVSVGVPEPTKSPVLPPRVSSTPGPSKPCEPPKGTPRLDRLRRVAKSNSDLRRLLCIVRHVVTARVLGRIAAPMDSHEFLSCLIQLTKAKLSNEKLQTLLDQFPFA